MTHPLVTQLRFARRELLWGLEGVTAEEAQHRFLPMNCISWMVGHLADHEHSYWLGLAQAKNIAPGLNDLGAFHLSYKEVKRLKITGYTWNGYLRQMLGQQAEN